jgi:hypothetical protein
MGEGLEKHPCQVGHGLQREVNVLQDPSGRFVVHRLIGHELKDQEHSGPVRCSHAELRFAGLACDLATG